MKLPKALRTSWVCAPERAASCARSGGPCDFFHRPARAVGRGGAYLPQPRQQETSPPFSGSVSGGRRVGSGPTGAEVGELGVGAPADGVHRTPVGTFAFDQAFGRQPNPGTKMPYFQATVQDW